MVALHGLQQRHQPAEPVQPDRRHVASASTGRVRHTVPVRRRGRAGSGPTTSATPASSTTRRPRFWCRSTHPTISDAGHVPPERDRRRQPPRGPTSPPPTRRIRSSCPRHVQLVGGVRFDRFDLDVPQQPQRRHARPRRRPRLAARRRRRQADRAAVDLRQLQRLVSAELRRPVLVAHHHHRAGRAGELRQLRGGRQVGRCRPACR